MSQPRTDDLLPSHPGEPYPTTQVIPRVEEKDLQGAVVPSTFAPGMVPVQIVSALPALPDPLWPQGYVVFLTTDNKLYRSTGTAWTVAVPTVDLTGQVTSAQITDLAVTTAKLNDLAVSTAKIAALAVDNGKIAALAVDSAKLADLAVTNAKIALLAVDTAQIAASAVSTAKIAALAVDNGKLAALAVDTAKLADNAVTTVKIAANTITAAKIAVNTLTTDRLVAGFRNFLSNPDRLNGSRNPGFEDGATFWSAGAGSVFVTDSAKAHSGNKYLEITGSAGVYTHCFQRDDADTAYTYLEVEEGDVIQFGGWGYRESGTASCRYVIEILDKDKANPVYEVSSTVTTAAWTQLSATYTVVSGKKYLRFVVEIANDGAGATVCRFDDSSIIIMLNGSSIVAASITAAKIAAHTITANEITALTITAAEIAAGTITGAKIAATTITAANIAALTITAAEIAASTITGAKIAANTITAAEIAANTITAAEIAAGTITGGKIAATTITAANIAALTITAAEIAASTITGAKIAANTITAANITALTITAAELAADSVTTNKILAGAVTAAKITVSTLSSIVADIGTITAGLLRDTASTFIADLTNALLTITDTQGSPVVRLKLGKIAGGATDYGLQIFDKDAATVADFTGAKRILAVPVQPSIDSGTSLTVDLSTGLTQQVRLTGTATITLSNPTNGGRYRIWFQQDATGSRPFPTILGPNGEVFMYTADTPPTLTTTPGAMDLFEFEYRTNPTTRFTVMTLQTNVMAPTPQVQSMTGTSVSSASVNHNVSMPATVNAGELLLMIITFHATQGSVTTPSGWTASGAIGLANTFTKAASGSEGGTTVNVVTGNSVKAAAQTYRITRWFGNAGTNGVVVTTNSGAPGTGADPSNNTPGWTDRTLWLAAVGVTGNPTFSVDPTNYANLNSTGDGASTCLVRSLRRTLYATSENPSTFTWSGSQSWAVFTIAVRPPA